MQASDKVERLAVAIGGRAGWTGSGLEFDRFPNRSNPPDALLTASAEGDDTVTFWAGLDACTEGWPGTEEWHVTEGCGVEADISVRCDALVDCGMHTIEEWDEVIFTDPVEALTLPSPDHYNIVYRRLGLLAHLRRCQPQDLPSASATPRSKSDVAMRHVLPSLSVLSDPWFSVWGVGRGCEMTVLARTPSG